MSPSWLWISIKEFTALIIVLEFSPWLDFLLMTWCFSFFIIFLLIFTGCDFMPVLSFSGRQWSFVSKYRPYENESVICGLEKNEYSCQRDLFCFLTLSCFYYFGSIMLVINSFLFIKIRMRSAFFWHARFSFSSILASFGDPDFFLCLTRIWWIVLFVLAWCTGLIEILTFMTINVWIFIYRAYLWFAASFILFS